MASENTNPQKYAETDFFHQAEGEDSTTYREEKLSRPEVVTRDGFDALMRGESRVIPGLKNEIYAAMTHVTPDGAPAARMYKKTIPVMSRKAGNTSPMPSRVERRRINRATGAATEITNHMKTMCNQKTNVQINKRYYGK